MSQGWRWCYLVTNAMASCMSCRVPTMDPLMIVIVMMMMMMMMMMMILVVMVVIAGGRR